MTTPALVHLDLTELVRNPIRSGIQRVEREAIRHWTGPKPVPCVVDARGRLLRLSPATLNVLCREDDGSPDARAAEQETLARLAGEGEAMADEAVRRLLNLELFFDPVRAEAHLRMASAGVRVMWYLRLRFLPAPGAIPLRPNPTADAVPVGLARGGRPSRLSQRPHA